MYAHDRNFAFHYSVEMCLTVTFEQLLSTVSLKILTVTLDSLSHFDVGYVRDKWQKQTT